MNMGKKPTRLDMAEDHPATDKQEYGMLDVQ